MSGKSVTLLYPLVNGDLIPFTILLSLFTIFSQKFFKIEPTRSGAFPRYYRIPDYVHSRRMPCGKQKLHQLLRECFYAKHFHKSAHLIKIPMKGFWKIHNQLVQFIM